MTIPPHLRLVIDDAPSREDRDFLDRTLDEMNEQRWPGHVVRNFAVFLRDERGRITAGLDAVCYGGWLFVNNLWIDERLRGQGIGRALMAKAEARAAVLGCHSAWLDTFSFQAPGFYRKLGYQIFGSLDHPPGEQRHFLQKRLSHSDPS